MIKVILKESIQGFYKGERTVLIAGHTVTMTEDDLNRAIRGARVEVQSGKHRHGYVTAAQISVM